MNINIKFSKTTKKEIVETSSPKITFLCPFAKFGMTSPILIGFLLLFANVQINYRF